MNICPFQHSASGADNRIRIPAFARPMCVALFLLVGILPFTTTAEAHESHGVHASQTYAENSAQPVEKKSHSVFVKCCHLSIGPSACSAGIGILDKSNFSHPIAWKTIEFVLKDRDLNLQTENVPPTPPPISS